MANCPVCNAEVNMQHANAARMLSTHQGQTHYFCGHECKAEFDSKPEHYTTQTNAANWADRGISTPDAGDRQSDKKMTQRRTEHEKRDIPLRGGKRT